MAKPTEKVLSPLTVKIIAAIKKIPRGRVATYQQIAGLAGRLDASRAVAWVLNSSSKKHGLPWQRVISKSGKIAFKPGTHHFRMQAALLRKEGIEVDRATGAIDMKRFQYKKHGRTPKPRKNQPRMFA